MKKIDNRAMLAPKLSGTGNVKYYLWVNEIGKLYVQIIENEGAGTFSNHLFSVEKYQCKRNTEKALGNLEAFNIKTKTIETVSDNNNGAFLKSILKHLLPDGGQNETNK